MGAKKLKSCKKSNVKQREMSDIELSKLMQTVEEIKKQTDEKLSEISSICLNRECNVKQS